MKLDLSREKFSFKCFDIYFPIFWRKQWSCHVTACQTNNPTIFLILRRSLVSFFPSPEPSMFYCISCLVGLEWGVSVSRRIGSLRAGAANKIITHRVSKFFPFQIMYNTVSYYWELDRAENTGTGPDKLRSNLAFEVRLIRNSDRVWKGDNDYSRQQ